MIGIKNDLCLTAILVLINFGQACWLPCLATEKSDLALQDEMSTAYSHHDYKKAIRDCNVLLSHDNDDTVILIYRGSAYISTDEPEKGLADFDRAAKINPKSITPTTLTARYKAYIALGRFDDAIKDLSVLVEAFPTLYIWRKERGQLYGMLKNYPAGINDLTVAIKLAPNQSINYLNRGNLYSTAGQYEKAVSDYTSLIKLEPNEPRGYGARAAVYKKMGLKNKANMDDLKANELGGWQM